MVSAQRSAIFSKNRVNPTSTTSATRTLSPLRTTVSVAHSAPDVASASQSYLPSPPVPSISDHATVLEAASKAHQNSINETDIVIAVMGVTGAGKSSFINAATGKMEAAVGKDLRPLTRGVQPVRCLHPDGLRNVVLVDTPGFDDMNLSDTQVLKIIAHWLKETYRGKIKLSGLLYLHRISDVRMGGTPLRNLSVFRDLCGDDNMKNVILVTTMWDEVQDESVGSKREEELRIDFWKDMIRLGSRTCRFQSTRESAWEVINHLDLERSHQTRIPLQIQKEMVDRRLQLHETTAAKTLFRSLVQLAEEGWRKLRNRARRPTSPREPSNSPRMRTFPSRSSSIRSSASSSWSLVSSTSGSGVASHPSTSPSSPAESTHSDCVPSGRGEALSVTIEVLKLAYQMADIAHIPVLRGVIGTVLQIAQLIQEMGGTHHAINQVIEGSVWLLEEITNYAKGSKLSKDMKRTLRAFHAQLNDLQKVVTKISTRSRVARFLLHDSDIRAITACTNSIKAIYDKLGVKLAIDNRQAIARLEDRLKELCLATSRQCECGISAAPREESEEDGQPSISTRQSL